MEKDNIQSLLVTLKEKRDDMKICITQCKSKEEKKTMQEWCVYFDEQIRLAQKRLVELD